MDFVQMLTFTIVVLLLVISPGPNGLLIVKTVSSSGKEAGFANVAGFIVSFYLHGALSLFGISFILKSSAEAFFIIKVLGAFYLMYIGIKSLYSSIKNRTSKNENNSNIDNKTIKKYFFEGLLTNVLNPKVFMFYLAAFPQFIPQGENIILYGFILVSIHALLNMFWFGSMVVLFSKLKTFANNIIFQRILKAFTGFVFIVFGLKLLSLETK